MPKGKQIEEGMSLDFSGVSIEPLPEGIPYLCTITQMKPGMSKESKPKIHVEYTVDEPEVVTDPDTGAEVKARKRKLFREYSLVKEALFGIYGLLLALGHTKEELKSGSFQPDWDRYIGQQVTVIVKNEEYQGTIQSRPQKVRPASVFSEASA